MAAEKIKVIFIEGDQEREIEALVGLSILEVAFFLDSAMSGANPSVLLLMFIAN